MVEGERPPGFRPLYAQVADLLAARVETGQWRPGDLLPSEPRIAEELGVSPGTVRKALDSLAARRLVERRQGKGTFVARITPERALFHFFHLVADGGERREPDSRVLWRRTGPADGEERARLGLRARARVLRVARVRSLGGAPVLVERIVVPAARFRGLAERPAENLPNALYALYEHDWGVSVEVAEERLRAVPASAEDARALDVREGAPLLEIDRRALDRSGRPVEWRVSRCRTDRHHYFNRLT